jgi:hypothetical protein
MFETRRMLRMMEQMKPANMFLRNTFFSNVSRSDREFVDIDIIKGKRRMAAFVSPIIGGQTVERQGYTTQSYKPLLIAPDMQTRAEDVLQRAAGENVYGAMSPSERASEILGRDLSEMDAMIPRREEWMCAQALFTGALTMTGEGVNESLSFGLASDHNVTLSAGSKWTDSGIDPIANLRTWRRKVIQDSGVNPDTVLLGASVVDAFIKNEEIRKQLDITRLNMGQIDPRTLPNGVTYYGRITSLALDLWGYDEWYLDDAGAEQPMIPVNKVLMASTQARTELLYGAVYEADVNQTFIADRVPKSWTQPKPSARFVALKSRPLPVPTQIDAFLVATVV